MDASPRPEPPAAGRLIVDASSVVRWIGPPVGIIRVEHEVVAHVLARRPDVLLCFWDAQSRTYRRLQPHWAGIVTGWQGAIDMIGRDVRPHLPRWRRWLSRYPLVMGLERRRLTTGSPWVARAADLAQRFLLALRRDSFPFADKRGRRLIMVPFDLAVGEDLAPGPEDVVLSVGCDWMHKEAADLATLKRQAGFRLVVLCYDIIPLLHPEFFPPAGTAKFRAHWLATFPVADRVVFNARRIEADAIAFCAAGGIGIGRTEVVPLGYEPPPHDAGPMPLREGLEPGRFALFVSTIEPRKGHRLLVDVWRALLARGVPQRHGFKLVFVGRRGWMVDDLMREIDDPAAFGFTLRHYADMEDDELAAHYRAAAFCLYPSHYEGFGLPIVEAFAHGKAVIASTGGAVPETVGGLSPCLDVEDPATWLALMERWIDDPQARADWEAVIRRSFARANWETSATALLAAAEAARQERDERPTR